VPQSKIFKIKKLSPRDRYCPKQDLEGKFLHTQRKTFPEIFWNPIEKMGAERGEIIHDIFLQPKGDQLQ
jgi:hypothetical protein